MIPVSITEQNRHELMTWLIARDLKHLQENLPEIGYIIPGIAAGFLRRVEGNIGMLDSFVTNPIAPPKDRDAALNAITAALITKAKTYNINQLLYLSVDEHTLERGYRFDFHVVPHKMMAVKLH